jgi:hypothetical protein
MPHSLSRPLFRSQAALALVNITYLFQARSAVLIAHSVPVLVAVYSSRVLFVNKVKNLFDFIEEI